jgi:hypothetical protein
MLVFDSNVVRRFILVGRPTPLTDFTTKAPVTSDSGKPLYRYPVLVVRDGGRPAQIFVKAPLAAGALEEGLPVAFQNLSGVLWERDGKQAVSFRAESVGLAPGGGK